MMLLLLEISDPRKLEPQTVCIPYKLLRWGFMGIPYYRAFNMEPIFETASCKLFHVDPIFAEGELN